MVFLKIVSCLLSCSRIYGTMISIFSKFFMNSFKNSQNADIFEDNQGMYDKISMVDLQQNFTPIFSQQ